MRAALLAASVFAVTCLVACGGDEAEPLALKQRILLEDDAPRSEPDPVEERVVAKSLDSFMGSHAAEGFESSALEAAGFVAAVTDTRFYPQESGGPHTRSAAHVRLLVLQFESDEGAQTGEDLVVEAAQEPCPETCALRVSDFDVPDVDGASGVRRLISAEALAEIGDPGEPFDSYSVVFADGEFAYELAVFGPPGKVSEEQAAEIAAKVQDRVAGAPAPS